MFIRVWGNFEHLAVSSTDVTATVIDTQTDEQVTLTASAVSEGAVANYTFTATLADQSHGDTPVTILDGNNVLHTITIADGQTSGHIDIASGNTEDVYVDPTSLKAHITAASGGNFEHLAFSSTDVSATVIDTQTDEQVTLTASAVSEGAVANYTFTATLADQSHGDTTVTILDGNNVLHIITIADGQTSGHIDIASGNTEDVYVDPTSLKAHITAASGGNFEHLAFSSTDVTATVIDTQSDEQVTLTASAVSEGAVANYTFTATLADQSHGDP